MLQPTGYFNLERLRRESAIGGVDFHAEVDSTNNRAIALAGRGDVATPLLVLAERQTAGRGRGANAWCSAPGALTFSLLFDAGAIGVAVERWPQISLAAALAVRQTVAELLPRSEVQVKWPNDVFLGGRKVAGILVEIPPVRPEKLVLGIGVNVNNSFAEGPAELREVATAMIDAVQSTREEEIANCKMQIAKCKMEDEWPVWAATGAEFAISNLQFSICNAFDGTDVLIRLLQALSRELVELAQGSPNLAARWRPHCFLRGRTISVQSAATTHLGVCRGIDETGALVLETETGPHRLLSGVITRYGP